MRRKEFIGKSLILSLMAGSTIKSLFAESGNWPDEDVKMPVIFVGHGAPTYVLGDNPYAKAWKKLGSELPKPKAVVCISAHWLTKGDTRVLATSKPKTIHDFGGFPQQMYEMQYPAPGIPELAEQISTEITSPKVILDHDWGFDHGTWCVLYHMYPHADVPVIQLSIDYNKPASYHYELGKQLQFLRKKGVLIIGSGNIVHNLRRMQFPEESKYDWAVEFDALSKKLMDEGNDTSLIQYEKLGQAALLSIPTPDHYFPLMYVLGARDPSEKIRYPIDGIAYGSTSMRSVIFG